MKSRSKKFTGDTSDDCYKIRDQMAKSLVHLELKDAGETFVFRLDY